MLRNLKKSQMLDRFQISEEIYESLHGDKKELLNLFLVSYLYNHRYEGRIIQFTTIDRRNGDLNNDANTWQSTRLLNS